MVWDRVKMVKVSNWLPRPGAKIKDFFKIKDWGAQKWIKSHGDRHISRGVLHGSLISNESQKL